MLDRLAGVRPGRAGRTGPPLADRPGAARARCWNCCANAAVSTAAFAAPLSTPLATVGGRGGGERIAGLTGCWKELGRGGIHRLAGPGADADFRREVALKLPLAPHLSGDA